MIFVFLDKALCGCSPPHSHVSLVPRPVPPPASHFSYSDIIIEREILMQKYIHLVQIMETEKVAANQLRTQLEDQDTEIERLKAEVCMSAPTSVCACIHKAPCCRRRAFARALRWSTWRGKKKKHVGKCIWRNWVKHWSTRACVSLQLEPSTTPVAVAYHAVRCVLF